MDIETDVVVTRLGLVERGDVVGSGRPAVGFVGAGVGVAVVLDAVGLGSWSSSLGWERMGGSLGWL